MHISGCRTAVDFLFITAFLLLMTGCFCFLPVSLPYFPTGGLVYFRITISFFPCFVCVKQITLVYFLKVTAKTLFFLWKKDANCLIIFLKNTVVFQCLREASLCHSELFWEMLEEVGCFSMWSVYWMFKVKLLFHVISILKFFFYFHLFSPFLSLLLFSWSFPLSFFPFTPPFSFFYFLFYWSGIRMYRYFSFVDSHQDRCLEDKRLALLGFHRH